jgi:hypothetical protein
MAVAYYILQRMHCTSNNIILLILMLFHDTVLMRVLQSVEWEDVYELLIRRYFPIICL